MAAVTRIGALRPGTAAVAGTVPLGRMGTPDDVAGLVLAMVGPFAPYLSGANIVLHGGGEWPAFLRPLGNAEDK